jgi:hypothetical protein
VVDTILLILLCGGAKSGKYSAEQILCDFLESGMLLAKTVGIVAIGVAEKGIDFFPRHAPPN